MAISSVSWSGTGNTVGGVVTAAQASLVPAAKAWLMNRDTAGGIRPWAVTDEGILGTFDSFRPYWLMAS